VAVSYEAASAFDPAASVHPGGPFPLVWAAAFDRKGPLPSEENGSGRASYLRWGPPIPFPEYRRAVRAIHRKIARGETYQVNYTFPLRGVFRGDEVREFTELAQSQGAGYNALIRWGRYVVMSVSPELFFSRAGSRLTVRPMKGTASRGRWPAEDEAQARRLKDSPKERAENLMIVDMIRNDLGKISRPGSVRVDPLFEVEKYPSAFQMTSTVRSLVPPSVRLDGIFGALFPSASVTGAPKVQTMKIIRSLERSPRGLYTGAIGLVKPGGDCLFNVAIRTVLLDRSSGRACAGVGGGITADSSPASEYGECRLKSDFFRKRPSFELLETILLKDGRYALLGRHLRRMRDSARYFSYPHDREAVEDSLARVRRRHPAGSWRVRLLSSVHGAVRTEVSPHAALPGGPLRVCWARHPVSSNDVFLFHKTTHRDAYERARGRAVSSDDVIYWNERGEVTESGRANIVWEEKGRLWTPPVESGLLAGTYREELLVKGILREKKITRSELSKKTSFHLINSVRRWMTVRWKG